MSADARGILAIDIGTSVIRATVVSLEGKALETRSVPTPTQRATPNAATLDAELCWRLTTDMIRAVSARYVIAAVGVSAQLGMVLVDAMGTALTQVMLWSDRTAEPQLEDVRRRLGARDLPALGRRIASELPAVRMRRLIETEPAMVARAAAMLSLKDYLISRLTGHLLSDPTHASYTLLFDVGAGRWSTQLANQLDLPFDLLPEVRTAEQRAGVITAAAAAACGLPENIIVAVGGPDGTVGSLGAGAIGPGRTVDIAGSTDVLVHVVNRPLFDGENVVTTNAHPLAGLWTIGGATGMTGGAVSWLSELLRYPDVGAMHEDLGEELRSVPIGSRGVLFDTALTGHRFPYWDIKRQGALKGITPDRTSADILSAAHEGSAFLMAEGLRSLARLGEVPTSVVVVGGIARRPASLQLRASVWGVPVEGISDGMATSRGAALLASVAGGLFGSIEEADANLTSRGKIYEPDPASREPLADAFAAWAEAF